MTTDVIFHHIVLETSEYLDKLHRVDDLWQEIEGHLSASYLAECLEDREVVSRQLGAVTRLLHEALDLRREMAIQMEGEPVPLA
jgi:hypothetical protein